MNLKESQVYTIFLIVYPLPIDLFTTVMIGRVIINHLNVNYSHIPRLGSDAHCPKSIAYVDGFIITSKSA